MLKITLLASGLVFFNVVSAKTYKVGLEPFPPIVNENSGGLTEELLKKAEAKMTDVKFEFVHAPYKRLKKSLLEDDVQLIGHTPYGSEVQSFYKYAEELDWSYPVCAEFVFTNPKFLKDFKSIGKIGTLVGNKGFLKELKGAQDLDIFEHVSMLSLVKMLEMGRIDAIWFPRFVINHYLEQHPVGKVYRKSFPERPLGIGLAVRKDKEGKKLRSVLEKALKQIDWRSEFDSKLKDDLFCVDESP